MKSAASSPKCIVCGNQKFVPLFEVETYVLHQCIRCNLVQTYPIETEAKVDILYDKAYFEGLTQRKQHEVYYQERILNLIEQYKTSGRMLEVGIGVGFFMELAHNKGWAIEGVEPSQAACRYVKATLKLPTHNGTLESVQLPENHFDVIVLRHVLEHVPAPLPFLRELHRILKDDGLLCLVVPNFGGLHARIEQAKWFHLSIPYHVAHYTPKTFRSVLLSCDFEIVKLRTLDLSCSSYLLEILNVFLRLIQRKPINIYVSPQETDPGKSVAHWIITQERFFNDLMARIGLGEEIVVIARKNV